MPETSLTQAEADALLALEKHRVDDTWRGYPTYGARLSVPLVSADGREHFQLDLYRGRINLSKGTYQTRARTIVVLARLDFGGPPHRNPDGQEIATPHLHLYRAGFGDKWAFPLPGESFPHGSDLWAMLQDFMKYCQITQPPLLQQSMFT